MRFTPYTIGLDLARSSDFTALTVLKHLRDGPDGWLYHLSLIDRWRSSYTDTVDRVVGLIADMTEQPALQPARVELVVDETGVGSAVVDLLVKRGLRPIGVVITGGRDVAKRRNRSYSVPKADLVAAAAVALETKRLRIRPDMQFATELIGELKAFRREETARGHMRFGNDQGDPLWREGAHDDLVLAVSLALWRAETGPKPTKPAVLNMLNPW